MEDDDDADSSNDNVDEFQELKNARDYKGSQ